MTMLETASRAEDVLASTPTKMLIGSDWVDAQSGVVLEVLNPATEQSIAQVPAGDAADVDRAVKAARECFEGVWSKVVPAERAKILWRLADLVDSRAADFAALEVSDNGKPIGEVLAIDIPLATDCLREMAGWATKISGQTHNLSVPYMPGAEFHAFTKREPVGVVGQIIPWNFPLLMATWKIGPAIATGCTVVLKPAEWTPLTALLLGELALEAGLPAGVVNIVTGLGETAGASLAAHPDVDKIAFTGSTEVGRKIVAAAGASNLKRVSLELGGKSPTLILGDADPEAAVAGTALASFLNQGQVCTAGSRVYADKRCYDAVVDGLASVAKARNLGNGLDEATEMGPLVSQEQFDKVTDLIQSGVSEGAELVAGGGSIDGSGYFVSPTVLANTSLSMRVEREEIFGPVITVSPVDDSDEAIRRANSSSAGLAAAVWTRDISKAHKTAAALRSGMVFINCYHVYDAVMPFGGFKQSGWGRELGSEVLELYTETKAITAAL
jgi:phenylacetaldehyde dehydrogenase